MTKEIEDYYLHKSEEVGITTLHWKRFKFKTKEDVDKWFEIAISMFEEAFNKEDDDMEE